MTEAKRDADQTTQAQSNLALLYLLRLICQNSWCKTLLRVFVNYYAPIHIIFQINVTVLLNKKG